MNKERILSELRETGAVAVIRTERQEELLDIVAALAEGGVKFIEITMTVPNALEIMRLSCQKIGDKAYIGAGTVLDSQAARSVMSAGARFVVSPVFDPEMVRYCNRYSIPVMPGAFTPSEVLSAWTGGADVVKIFPANIGGPKYFKDLKGPLPQVEILPTGGVDFSTAPLFIQAGACAVGIGGALVDPAAVKARDFEVIRQNAAKLVQIIREARSKTR
jgi:2-dehydro-3-deoxyphosphogluconate aldolase/(4S)-4-hydroxy-2-oxoglutarate aldolase